MAIVWGLPDGCAVFVPFVLPGETAEIELTESKERYARDLKHLAEAGYAITTLHAYDMFPQTKHVETCAYLSKLKSSKHIKVNLELEDLDVTKAESKPTYEDIKKHVMESSGIKVSTLNIAQMKRKHGLIERKSYNFGNGKTKQPPLTAKKERAIEDAFVFFNLL